MNEQIAQILARTHAAKNSHRVMQERVELLLSMAQPLIFQFPAGSGGDDSVLEKRRCEDRAARMLAVLKRVCGSIALEVKSLARTELMGLIARRALECESEVKRYMDNAADDVEIDDEIDIAIHEALLWLHNDLVHAQVLKPDSTAELVARQAKDETVFVGAFSKRQQPHYETKDERDEWMKRRGRNVLKIYAALAAQFAEAGVSAALGLHGTSEHGLDIALVPSAALPENGGTAVNAHGKPLKVVPIGVQDRVMSGAHAELMHNLWLPCHIGAQFDGEGEQRRCVGQRYSLRPVHWLHRQSFVKVIESGALQAFPLLREFAGGYTPAMASMATHDRLDVAYALRPSDTSSEYAIMILQVLHSGAISKVSTTRDLRSVVEWRGVPTATSPTATATMVKGAEHARAEETATVS